MDDKVEQVARAIQDKARIYDCDPGDPLEKWAMESARAAIEAMREPTGKMLAASKYATIKGNVAQADRAIWQAMIDAALSNGKET